jgi:hypothetical protein
MVLIDRNDFMDNQDAYMALTNVPLGWHFEFTNGETQGEKIAEVWDDVKHCSWLGLIGDDCVPETPGWDKRMVAALDGANIVSCNDGWQAPKRIANCWIMAGDLVRLVGYIFPPGMQHLYVDDVWETIGRNAGCWRVLMDVKVAHRHVFKNEAEADETHRRVYGDGTMQDGMWPGDREAFLAWINGEQQRIAVAVAELRRGMAGPEEAERAAARNRELNARVKTRSLLVGTPCHGDPKMAWARSMLKTWDHLAKFDIQRDLLDVSGSSILPKVRNAICAWFLASGHTDLIMIDADMGWQASAIVHLLASPHPVIGAVGRRKTDEKVSWCYRPLPGDGVYELDEMGSMRVQCIGTGILKISREALEKIIEARPDLKLPGSEDMPATVAAKHYNFFHYGPLQEGEDYMFCDLWRSVGGEVWVAPNIEVTHVGEKEYVGKFGDDLMPVHEAANDNDAAEREAA